ncbi:MAG: type II toxin-antitoxin system RatA family toxin [Wigglesworthia glossinidia]|nr:type II toxin-antitoxin system RatA family toxin [Wigglesworthia glossinidia]
MSHITEIITVPYNVKYIFSLVNDVNNYSKFIPWCTSSKILKKNNNIFICEIQLSFLGFKEILVTKNKCIKDISIFIQLISGKFNQFSAIWNFFPISPCTTKIKFELIFFSNHTHINAFFNLFLKNKANDIINFFLKEAYKKDELK